MQVDPAVQVFQNLRVELANVTQALTAQGISSIVSRFDGNPKNERYMKANVGRTWAQMKAQLVVRFSDVTDNQMVLSLVWQVRQKTGENIQNYAERILSLAEEAYDNQEGGAIERQLTDIFVDGLLNDQLKMKIRRDQTNTLQGAVATCTNEQNLRTRVQMSH